MFLPCPLAKCRLMATCHIMSLLICSLFPPIVDEQERLNYKREFDLEHQEYKSLQAELEGINQDLADLDRELDRHPEGSAPYLVSRGQTPIQETRLQSVVMAANRKAAVW